MKDSAHSKIAEELYKPKEFLEKQMWKHMTYIINA
jgi:hypothetical protein